MKERSPVTKDQIGRALRRLASDRRDEEAWRVLFEGSWSTGISISHWVLRGQLDLAQDVTQEAFRKVIAYCDFTKVQDPEAFLAYLRTVCINIARDELRRLAPETDQLLDEDVEVSQHRAIATPELLVLASRLKEELIGLLNQTDQKLVSLLVEGYSLREIATQLNLTYSNVAVRLHRVRSVLFKYLEKKNL